MAALDTYLDLSKKRAKELNFIFRGQSYGGGWFTGRLTILDTKVGGVEPGWYINNRADIPFAYDVKPETVSQFTGKTDINNRFIFEGDLIKNGNGKILLVYFNNVECGFRQTTNLKNPGVYDESYGDMPLSFNQKEVVGNIFENPELLESK